MLRKTALMKASSIHTVIKDSIIAKITNDNTITLNTIRNHIELLIRNSLPDELNNGIAFPIGLNVDSVVAHFTPVKYSSRNSNLPAYFDGDVPISKFKILKIDYGVHINGYIIDAAFSLNLDGSELCDILIRASQECVNNVIKNIGVDTPLNELADIAHEIVSSFEYESTQLKLVDNVYSHSINQWCIHGTKFIKPDYKQLKDNICHRIEDNEQYAIEFYPSYGNVNRNGKSMITNDRHVYTHYRLINTTKTVPIFQISHLNKIMDIVKSNFKTLPFCPNFIINHPIKEKKKRLDSYDIIESLQTIFNYQRMGYPEIIESYPPIIELDSNALVSQTEKTITIDNGIVNTY